MKITNNGYNVPEILLDTNLPINTLTKVGTGKDFSTIFGASNKSGTVRVKGSFNSKYVDATMNANYYAGGDGIELSTITSGYADSPYIVFVQLTLSGGDCYAYARIIELS